MSELASAAYIVRFGRMRHLGTFADAAGRTFDRGSRVVLKTDRGTELGEVLCPASERATQFLTEPARGTIERPAQPTDLAADDVLTAHQAKGFEVGGECIARRGLRMKLVDVECLLGGERMIFYYLAESRVDFRELVKDLARVFRTRIEMRQIGIRDEAKLLADYGDCGKPVCCNTHLTRMPPVSMRMVKLQKSTLDPGKISGRCGRLKCCLRYEFDTYAEAESDLPAVGSSILTSRGTGRVLALELLARRIVIELEDRRKIVIGPDEVLGITSGSNARGLPRTDAEAADMEGPADS